MLNDSGKFQKFVALFLVGGLLLGNLSIVTQSASAGPSGSQPGQLGPDLLNPLFLPFISNKISDLYITALEVTQAVQNISSPVNMVANRPAEARIYAYTTGEVPVGNLYASLTVYKNGVQVGTLTAGPGTAYPQSNSLDTLRADATKSFNFSLPAGWLNAGTLTFTADIDIHNIAMEMSEINLKNYQYSFNTIPALTVVAVPVHYIDGAAGDFPAPDVSYLQQGLFRMYPVPAVNVAIHSATTFNGSLSTNDADWENLLNQIDDIKQTEGNPTATVYFGVIPLLNGAGTTWFDEDGGVVGYGWVGYRTSIAVTKATIPTVHYGPWALHGDDFAAHEIGHNLNMDHTPCNVASPYTDYPYANGAIGQYGYNVSEQTVIVNTDPDIMSYCEPEWVSDFTYKVWYAAQQSTLARVAAPAQSSLYVRAKLASDGSASLQPVYEFSASPSELPASSEYSVQFLDDQGKLVSEYPVSVMRAEEKGHKIESIHARLPRPSQPYSSIQVVHNGQSIATRAISSQAIQALAPVAAPTVRIDAGDLVLNWANGAAPALVRYTSDGGQSWTTVGVDVSGSELRLAVADLPAMPLQFQVTQADGLATATVDWAP